MLCTGYQQEKNVYTVHLQYIYVRLPFLHCYDIYIWPWATTGRAIRFQMQSSLSQRVMVDNDWTKIMAGYL